MSFFAAARSNVRHVFRAGAAQTTKGQSPITAAARNIKHNHLVAVPQRIRCLSTNNGATFEAGHVQFQAKMPETLTREMAEGILQTTKFFCSQGIPKQRLVALSEEELPLIQKWQSMMQIYLLSQAGVISHLGYPPTEEGLTAYARQLGEVLQNIDETWREIFIDLRKETWRFIVATTFKFDPSEVPDLSIVDARNYMHKITSKMSDPNFLLILNQTAGRVQNLDDQQAEISEKHAILQHQVIEHVYLGGNPSIVEEAGLGSGDVGYAKLQCALADHEGDPLIAQYSAAAMVKMFEAAGIELSDIQGPGLSRQ
jgi:hypothetical protein